uniref:Uncharacterized protein n=1 Tax=Lepeophtheirus salmonis TaxID=72036 RepID=A0A0K2UPW9_LEPSM
MPPPIAKANRMYFNILLVHWDTHIPRHYCISSYTHE